MLQASNLPPATLNKKGLLAQYVVYQPLVLIIGGSCPRLGSLLDE